MRNKIFSPPPNYFYYNLINYLRQILYQKLINIFNNFYTFMYKNYKKILSKHINNKMLHNNNYFENISIRFIIILLILNFTPFAFIVRTITRENEIK